MDYFAKLGCCCADHGLSYVPWREAGETQLEEIFKKVLAGGSVTREEEEAYKTHLLIFCGQEYARRGWVMQLHIQCGTLRKYTHVPETGAGYRI